MIALSWNQYNIPTLHSSTSHLTCCRLYRFSVTHYHFYTNTPFFRFVLHPHSKRNTYVNLSSFESLIRRLSHHHPQRHLYFTMTNAIFDNPQKKIEIIKTTAIWWSKHHSTYLSSSYSLYVALLPARKTTITLLLKLQLLLKVQWLPIMDPPYYNIYSFFFLCSGLRFLVLVFKSSTC